MEDAERFLANLRSLSYQPDGTTSQKGLLGRSLHRRAHAARATDDTQSQEPYIARSVSEQDIFTDDDVPLDDFGTSAFSDNE